MSYNSASYWEHRLSRKFDLSGVGHIGFNQHYNKWLYKAKVRVLERALIDNRISVEEGLVCDVGCGTGYFVSFYSERKARHVLGLDITAVSTNTLTQQFPKFSFLHESITSATVLDRITSRFDIVNAFDVMYHVIDDQDFAVAVANVCRLTKPGGIMFITDLFTSQSRTVAEHVRVRCRSMYSAEMDKWGVEIVSSYPLYYLLNREIMSRFCHPSFWRIGNSIDNVLAPIYFFLDRLLTSSVRSNLELVVARRKQ